VSTTDPTALPWVSFDCAGSKRWRLLSDGKIEIEGEGSPASRWPTAVDQWKQSVVHHSSTYNIPPAWVAAIMSIESGGNKDACRRTASGGCSTREGVGLMALMPGTALSMAGRPVSQDELKSNPDLSVALGTKYFKMGLDAHGGDPVKASVQYNAGRVVCGHGRTWVPDGNMPREDCPTTDWNVVEGCVTSARSYGSRCAPSTLEPGKYVCTIDRPREFIMALNAAVNAGWGIGTDPGPWPGTEPVEEPSGGSFLAKIVPFAAGTAFGYYAIQMTMAYVKKYATKRA